MWTEEQIESVKSLWALGYTALEIAEKCDGLTRSAVLWKIGRLRSGGAVLASRTTAPRGWVSRNINGPKIEPPDIALDADGQRYTILSVPFSGRCKFPHGQPDDEGFHLCGNAAEDTYCPYHQQLCYLSVKVKRAAPLERLAA